MEADRTQVVQKKDKKYKCRIDCLMLNVAGPKARVGVAAS